MMAPAGHAVLLVWMIVPLAMTLWFSFQNYNLLSPRTRASPAGQNYVYVITDPGLPAVDLAIPLILVGGVLLITVIGGTFLALLLDQPIWGQGLIRILVISPVLRHAAGRGADLEEHAA